jgi:hypothetical protein
MSKDDKAVGKDRAKQMATEKADDSTVKINRRQVGVSVKKISGGREQYLYRFKAALMWLSEHGTPTEFATDYRTPTAENHVVRFIAPHSNVRPKGMALRVAMLDSGNDVIRSITHSIGPVADSLSVVVVLDCAKDVFESLA